MICTYVLFLDCFILTLYNLKTIYRLLLALYSIHDSKWCDNWVIVIVNNNIKFKTIFHYYSLTMCCTMPYLPLFDRKCIHQWAAYFHRNVRTIRRRVHHCIWEYENFDSTQTWKSNSVTPLNLLLDFIGLCKHKKSATCEAPCTVFDRCLHARN